jgi:uncharacterized protein YbjT (DUF2867 family)
MDYQAAAVTGATGHLGNVLVRELLRLGKRVRALVQPGDDCRALAGLGIDVVRGDVLRPETLSSAFAGVELVFHLAGVVSISSLDVEQVRTVNIEGTRNVVEEGGSPGPRLRQLHHHRHQLPDPGVHHLHDDEAGEQVEEGSAACGPAGHSRGHRPAPGNPRLPQEVDAVSIHGRTRG